MVDGVTAEARAPSNRQMLENCRAMALMVGHRQGTLFVAFGGSSETRRLTVHHTLVRHRPADPQLAAELLRGWPTAVSLVGCDLETGQILCELVLVDAA